MKITEKISPATTFRLAAAGDEEFLYQLYCSTREDELNAAGFPLEQREPFLRMQFNAQKTHYEKFYPAAEHRIIKVDERRVGREYVKRSDEQILLVDLVLLPEFCGLGIGTKLLEALCEESDGAGKPFRLYALKDNERALRLYERLAFRTIEDAGVYLFLERCPNQQSN